MAIVDYYKANETGRDFVVGDIHGCFHVLQKAMIDLAFDRSKDRLFSVGDLVNRGPLSHHVLWWLNQPWFHAVKGNHEIMTLTAFHGTDVNKLRIGDWLVKLEKAELEELYWKLNHLPLAIEVKSHNGGFGIIHADILHTDWKMFVSDLTQDGPNSQLADRTLWEKNRIKHNHHTHVDRIGAVYCGHVVVDKPINSANVVYIDTGCCYNRKLTLMDAGTQTYYSIDYFLLPEALPH